MVLEERKGERRDGRGGKGERKGGEKGERER